MSLRFTKAKAAHIRLGIAGEAAAARMYRNAGCEVLMRDCRFPNGEIDLVVRDGLTLVFAEVKTSRVKKLEQVSQVRPGIRLHPKQKRRIYRASLTYMREIGKPAVPFRYDLVEMVYLRSVLYEVRHWKSAFGQRDFKKTEKKINLFR